MVPGPFQTDIFSKFFEFSIFSSLIFRKPKAMKCSQPAQKSPPKEKPKRHMEENLRTSYMAPLPPSTPVLAVIPTYVNYDCVVFVQRIDDDGKCAAVWPMSFLLDAFYL
jgi:hypothetical protein